MDESDECGSIRSKLSIRQYNLDKRPIFFGGAYFIFNFELPKLDKSTNLSIHPANLITKIVIHKTVTKLTQNHNKAFLNAEGHSAGCVPRSKTL